MASQVRKDRALPGTTSPGGVTDVPLWIGPVTLDRRSLTRSDTRLRIGRAIDGQPLRDRARRAQWAADKLVHLCAKEIPGERIRKKRIGLVTTQLARRLGPVTTISQIAWKSGTFATGVSRATVRTG